MAGAKKAKMANRTLSGVDVKADLAERFTAVARNGARVYPGDGVSMADAVNLASGLAVPAGIARIEADGTLTLGFPSGKTFVPVREFADAELMAA